MSLARFCQFLCIIAVISLPIAHELIGIDRNHPSFHGGAKDLVYMHVQFESAMFENEIEYDAHYMGWWTVCGE